MSNHNHDFSGDGFGTRAIHAGQAPDPSTGAIMTPVYMTSTYVQEAPGQIKGYDYSRTCNPTRNALEANIAALEGAPRAILRTTQTMPLRSHQPLTKSASFPDSGLLA